MGSRMGTCYFYYSHAALHKYGWETRSRATGGGKPRAVKWPDGPQQEIAAVRGPALLFAQRRRAMRNGNIIPVFPAVAIPAGTKMHHIQKLNT